MGTVAALVAYAVHGVDFPGGPVIQAVCRRHGHDSPPGVVGHFLRWLHGRGVAKRIKAPLVLRSNACGACVAEIILSLPELDALFQTTDGKVRFREGVSPDVQQAIEQFVAAEFPVPQVT